MSYRDDLDALASRHAVLAAQLAAKRDEVDDAARVLADAQKRARLPVLDNIRVATPCPAKWDDMVGNERVRACGGCQKNVYDISMLTRAEAEALILAKEGKLCLRYYQRADGTILLKDCAIAVSKNGRRRWISLGAAALLAGGAIAAQRGPAPEKLASTESTEPVQPSWSHVPKKGDGTEPRKPAFSGRHFGYTGGLAAGFAEALPSKDTAR